MTASRSAPLKAKGIVGWPRVTGECHRVHFAPKTADAHLTLALLCFISWWPGGEEEKGCCSFASSVSLAALPLLRTQWPGVSVDLWYYASKTGYYGVKCGVVATVDLLNIVVVCRQTRSCDGQCTKRGEWILMNEWKTHCPSWYQFDATPGGDGGFVNKFNFSISSFSTTLSTAH